MVAIPGVRYRLPCVFGDTTCEMKGCLHCKCFSSTKFVKWREIHGAARRAVVFPCYDHAVAPGHGLAVWHTFNYAKCLVAEEVTIYPLLPVQGYVGGRVARLGCSSWFNVDFDWRPLNAE